MPAGIPGPARTARIYAALAGSPWADAADREAVSDGAYPGSRAAKERMRQVREYHSAAAAQAVTRGVRGIVFGACGLPAEPEPHTAAAEACPDARFVYADSDRVVAKIGEAVLGGTGRVSACEASLRDPGGLLGCPEVAALPRPVQVQVQMALHFWAPALARDLIGEYARRLSPGDEVLITWTLTADTAGGRELAGAAARVTGRQVHRHTARDVAGWLDDAGLLADGAGPADVRGRAPAWAERERAAKPARAMGAAARVP